MISLDEFLQQKHIVKYRETITINFPVLEKPKTYKDNYKYIRDRYIEIPKGNFYIYNDKYHNRRHISTLNDIAGMCQFYEDFEDFCAKDIIRAFDTLKEAVEFAIEDKDIHRYYDSNFFMDDVLNRKISDEDYLINTYDDEYSCTTFGGTMMSNILNGWDVDNLPKNYCEFK